MIYALEYFQRPYEDSDYLSIIIAKINDIYYTVYKPNHGLAHSLRQGFLVRDIIKLLTSKNLWLINEIEKDNMFPIKVAILSSFQRSGRQSEISSSSDPLLYEKYENDDIKNFSYKMSSTPNPYFANSEINLWASALKWDCKNELHTIQEISKLIKAAHLLDLRRIPSFDPVRIKYEVSELLDITPNSDVMDILWNQSGKYLNICGDRDLVINKRDWSDRFFVLHQNPNKLYYSLRNMML